MELPNKKYQIIYAAEKETIYDAGCMKEIIEFMWGLSK